MKELTKRLTTLGITFTTPQQAKAKWDLSELSQVEAQQATGVVKPHGAIEIAYGGNLPSRYRWLTTDPNDNLRYYQPKDSGVLVYIPKPLRPKLKESPYIVITEGEFKSIAACNRNIPCIALSGVWSFMIKDGPNNILHPTLNDLPKVPIYICFDYDPHDGDPSGSPKQQVKQAEDHLAAQLIIRGYTVKVIRLATTAQVTKIGLDDWLAANNDVAWQRKMEAALVPLLRGLPYMLSTYVTLGTSLYDTRSNTRLKPSDFKTFTTHIKLPPDPLANELIKTPPLSQQFLASPHKVRAHGFIMDPSQPQGLTPYYRLNIWQGYRTEPQQGEDISPYLSFKELIFRSEPHLEPWFDRFVALLFQRPQVKQTILPILTSTAQGVGKSTLAETIAAVMNGTYRGGVNDRDDHIGSMPALVLDTKALESKFNSILSGVKLLVVNEMGLSLDRGNEQRLKDLMTSPTLRIEPKGFEAMPINNIIQVIGTSNEVVTHRMKADSRRELIISIPEHTEQCDDLQYLMRSKEYHTWLYCDAQKTGGPLSPLSIARLSAIHHWYVEYPLGHYDGTEDAPRSEGKTTMSTFSANDTTNKFSDFLDEHFSEYNYVMPVVLQRKYGALFPNNRMSRVDIGRALMELGWTYPAGADKTPHQYFFPKDMSYPPGLKAKQIIMRRHADGKSKASAAEAIHKDIVRMYNDAKMRHFFGEDQ